MRTRLRGKFSLLFLAFGLLLAIPAVALADTLIITNDVNVNANATHAPGDTGTANVTLNNTNNTPGDTNGCNATGANPLTATLSSNNSDVIFPSGNTATITGCGVAVPVSYKVVNSAQVGTAVISASVSGGVPSTTTDPRSYNTSDTLTVNITAPPNTAPTVPGKPGLASGSVTPNQGVFTLNWTASTDDGNPSGSSVTYRLEQKDADDAGYSLVSGAGSLSTHSFSFTAGSPEDEGTWTYQVRASDGSLNSNFSTASDPIKVDRTPPSAPTTATTNPANPFFSDWFKDTVTVSYGGSTDGALPDTSAGSGVASYSGPDTFNTSGSHDYSGTATDGAGNVSSALPGTVKVDTNKPTFGTCPSGGPFLVNSGSHSVGPIIASDGDESGIDSAASTLSGSVNTSSTGTKQVTFTAKDNVGHSDTKTCDYNVDAYDFIGFSSPVDNPTVLNTVKAGQAIPLKWRLMDNGSPVTNLQSVTVTASALSCSLGSTTDLIEEVASGSSGLQNLGDGYYQYNWKSPTSYAKSCKTLQINGVGMQLTAQQQPLFQFTR